MQQLVYEVDMVPEIEQMLELTKYCSDHLIEFRLTEVVNENFVAQFRIAEIEYPNVTEEEEKTVLDELMFQIGYSSWTTIVEDMYGKVLSEVYDDYPSKTTSQILTK